VGRVAVVEGWEWAVAGLETGLEQGGSDQDLDPGLDVRFAGQGSYLQYIMILLSK